MNDIVDAIDQIDKLLHNKTLNDVAVDRPLKAAFERFLEILSEASRHIPEEVRAEFPNIPWSSVANIGNHLRHAYHRVDSEILWRTYADGQLAELRTAIVSSLSKSSK